MAYQRKDAYYHKAKREGERSRAAYKLEQLEKKFHLFRRGDKVLDIGNFPGGWTQIAARKVGLEGVVIGVDLDPVDSIPEPCVKQIQGDITDPEIVAKVREGFGGEEKKVQVVMSDASPKLSGVRDADSARQLALVEAIYETALQMLAPGGHFIAKVFSRATPHELIADAKKRFKRVKQHKPDASRKESSEIYLVCCEFKGEESP